MNNKLEQFNTTFCLLILLILMVLSTIMVYKIAPSQQISDGNFLEVIEKDGKTYVKDRSIDGSVTLYKETKKEETK